jgi:C-terminal peptidase prc
MRYIYLIFLIFFLAACDNKTTYKDKDCTVAKQNEFVYNYMKRNYLWNKELPELDYLAYDSPAALLEDLKVELDKWSFIISKQALDAYFSGLGYVGLGFKIKYLNDDLYITLVYPNSPAARAALQRGDKILKINNKEVQGKDYTFVNDALGYDQEGVKVDLEVEKSDGSTFEVTLYKEQIETPSVLKRAILDVDGVKVAYIMFDKFIEPSTKELLEAFKEFKAQNIEKIIVDLRYNGGGLVGVANDFVSLLIGEDYSNDISLKLQFNEENSYKNKEYRIKKFDDSMALYDIYFLTTHRTCSSSEALINALKPYNIDIHLIGSKTCGKPVGMVGKDFCDFYLMPIEFKLTNANDEGDYFNGLEVACSASDDITHDFGDENESMLKEALFLMKNGVCSTSARVIQEKTKEQELKGFKQFNGGAF